MVSGAPLRYSEVGWWLHQVSAVGQARPVAVLPRIRVERDENPFFVASAGIRKAFTPGCTPTRSWGRSATFLVAAAKHTVPNSRSVQAADPRMFQNVSCRKVVRIKPQGGPGVLRSSIYLAKLHVKGRAVRP